MQNCMALEGANEILLERIGAGASRYDSHGGNRQPGSRKSGSARRPLLYPGLESAHLCSAKGADRGGARERAKPSFEASPPRERLKPIHHAALIGCSESSRSYPRGGNSRADTMAPRRPLLQYMVETHRSELGPGRTSTDSGRKAPHQPLRHSGKSSLPPSFPSTFHARKRITPRLKRESGRSRLRIPAPLDGSAVPESARSHGQWFSDRGPFPGCRT